MVVRRKRGQISIFFIVGTILILLLFLVTLFSEKPNVEQTTVSDPRLEVTNFIKTCLEKVGTDAVYAAMLQGGNYFHSLESSIYYDAVIPHYWNFYENKMPPFDEVEDSISYFVVDQMNICLNNFESFTNRGMSIQIKEVEPDFVESEEVEEFEQAVAIVRADKEIAISYLIEIEIVADQSRYTIDSTSVTVPIDIKTPYHYAQQILAEQAKDPETFPVGFIANLANENDFTFELIIIDDERTIVGLLFPQASGKDLVYSFIHRFGDDRSE